MENMIHAELVNSIVILLQMDFSSTSGETTRARLEQR